MAKTDSLIIVCARVDVSPAGNRNSVSADLVDINVEYVLDDISNEDISNWCQQNLEPEDIFSETQLDKWAEANGYVKGGEQ